MGEVVLNLKPLQTFTAMVRNDSGPIQKGFKQWGEVYRSFIWERFDTYSKGGGDWKPLSPKTIARRRKGSGSGLVAAILVDLAIMKNALAPNLIKPGRFDEKIKGGIRVGYGGPDKHKGSTFTIARLARMHHEGKGRLPKREIIVEPDHKTVVKMIDVMEVAIRRAT